MDEILTWWWKYYLSRRDIEKMKKNMKKVPIIQKKAEKYHKNQNEEAELFINQSLKNSDIPTIKKNISQNNNDTISKEWFRKKLIHYINNLLSNKPNGN